EVQVVARMPQKPCLNFLGLVGGIVVQHQMDGKIGRNGAIDLLQEFAELDGAMAWPALADHRSRGDVQGREKTGGAMAFVIVGAALGLTWQHGKDRLAAAQRLNLALFIHAQHQGVMRRIQIQAYDVPYLIDEQRIVGQLERFAAMGAQSKRPPDATDRRLTQSGPRCQRTTAPMRRSFGGFFQGQPYGPFDALIADLSWRSRPRLSPKAAIPPLIKRFRHRPTVKAVVRSLVATAALLLPLAHSKTMRARKASERELRGCCSNCRKAIFCSGLTTRSCFLGRPRGFGMIHDNPFALFIQSIYDS